MSKADKQASHVDYGTVALLALAAWEKDGSPPGRELLYWSEVEQQLQATRHLLLADRLTTPPVPPNIGGMGDRFATLRPTV